MNRALLYLLIVLISGTCSLAQINVRAGTHFTVTLANNVDPFPYFGSWNVKFEKKLSPSVGLYVEPVFKRTGQRVKGYGLEAGIHHYIKPRTFIQFGGGFTFLTKVQLKNESLSSLGSTVFTTIPSTDHAPVMWHYSLFLHKLYAGLLDVRFGLEIGYKIDVATSQEGLLNGNEKHLYYLGTGFDLYLFKFKKKTIAGL